MIKKFTINVEMEERWINHFMSMLNEMEKLGKIGSTRTVGMVSDGDGDFRPKFTSDIDFEIQEPARLLPIRIYDAG